MCEVGRGVSRLRACVVCCSERGGYVGVGKGRVLQVWNRLQLSPQHEYRTISRHRDSQALQLRDPREERKGRARRKLSPTAFTLRSQLVLVKHLHCEVARPLSATLFGARGKACGWTIIG